MDADPSANGDNGRDAAGRFVAGNPGGPGNPHARHTEALRRALLDAVTADDIRAVVGKLVELAKAGDLAAIRALLDRAVGKPTRAAEDDAPRVELAIGADRTFPTLPPGYTPYNAGDSAAEATEPHFTRA